MVQLVEPAFGEQSEPYPGRIADYPPGVRENGGQYSHGASWLVDAFVQLADQAAQAGDTAAGWPAARPGHRDLGQVSPVDDIGPGETDRYGLPPHQQPADVYFGTGYEGRGGWSWYTGSAGRMLAAAHAILGFRMENGQLIVPPTCYDAEGCAAGEAADLSRPRRHACSAP